jgi:hypothetical protein
MTAVEIRLALYAGVLALLAGWMAYERTHLIDEGEARELAKMAKSSQQLLAQAKARIATQDQDHAAFVASNRSQTDVLLKANSTLSDTLDQRVRDFDAYRRAHPDVSRAAGGPAATGAGECGAQSCGDLAVQLARRGNELARSNGELTAALQASQRDRDALTGLPK